MAGADGRPLEVPVSRPLWGLRASADWRTSVLLLAGLISTDYGLHVVLSGVAWFFEVALIGALVLGASAGTRLLSRRLLLPPLVSVLAFFAVSTAVFAPGTGVLAIIPTGDTFATFGRLLDAAGRSIAEQSPPAAADAGITFLLCIGIAAIALACDLFAILLRMPAMAGIPLLVLLAAPAVIEPGSIDPIAFVGSAVVYLFLLRLGNRGWSGGLALGIGALTIALTLVLPLALPAVEVKPAPPQAGPFGTGVNPVLSLGKDLRQNSTRTVLRYHTSSGDAHYLRLVSVEDFSGSEWAPDAFSLDRGNTVDRLGSPPGLSRAVARTTDTTTVQVAALSSTWLPLPYPSTTVSGLDGSWYWDSNGLAVASTDRTTSGQSYRVSDLELEPSPAQLLTAGTTVPAHLDRFLAVPKNLPAIVSNTARAVVGTAPTNYEKALLLQSYFHDGDFEYSETAPVDDGYDGTGGQVIAKFLRAKSGYCIHFASAMAMMARVLGIPARISVGFLPGQQVGDTGGESTYAVSSRDLHAWPELYFTGIGWTRFEPTVSRGDVPTYADLAQPDVPVPSATDNPTPTTSTAPSTAPAENSAPAPTATSAPLGTSASGTDGGGWTIVGLVALGLVVIALIPAIVRAIQRSSRLHRLARGRAPVLTAWLEVLQSSADVGSPIAATLTPREAAGLLIAGGTSADPALERLLAALEHERFAERPTAYPGAVADTRRVIAAVAVRARRGRRILAALFPPSIWRLLVPAVDREAR